MITCTSLRCTVSSMSYCTMDPAIQAGLRSTRLGRRRATGRRQLGTHPKLCGLGTTVLIRTATLNRTEESCMSDLSALRFKIFAYREFVPYCWLSQSRRSNHFKFSGTKFDPPAHVLDDRGRAPRRERVFLFPRLSPIILL